MTQDKRNYIQAVSSKTLLELIQNLLINSGIDSLIRISDNQIEATIEAGVAGTFKNVYCMLAEPLSKNYSGMNPLSEEIDRRFKNGCSKFYLVSNHSISTGFRVKLEQTTIHKNSIVYWDTDDLLKNIEKNYPDYWRHNDQSLITYEKYFENRINESFEIKKLVEYKAAYQKLLSIFIEPNIFLKTDDKQSTKKAFTKVNLERVLIENERLMVLHGDPGTGKTRLLYEIGRLFIRQNSVIAGKRHLPIFIDSVNLRILLRLCGMKSGLVLYIWFLHN
ncbi:MAG: hypothetical protein R2830_04190 [Saprospiraceae bacterium]